MGIAVPPELAPDTFVAPAPTKALNCSNGTRAKPLRSRACSSGDMSIVLREHAANVQIQRCLATNAVS